MLTLTRRQARRLRGIFRRHMLGITHRAAIPPLVLRAEESQLRTQYRYASLAIEFATSGSDQPDEAIALPLDALADFEGRDEFPVVLEAAAPDRTVVRWVDHGVPQTREFAVPAIASLAAFPVSPTSWSDVPPELLDSLAEANATTCDQSTRYALNCLQLRGGAGEIAATDGHQLLIRGGFHFPWEDSLLVRRSPVFACRVLPRDRPVRLGRTETHIVLGVGPWTLYLEVQAEGRFPVLGDVVPHPDAAVTRLRLDPDDAHFLAEALGRLPGTDEPNAPATLDLNGVVAIRARDGDASPTELVLSRSSYTGTPVRLSTHREFLGRAIRLGFSELEIIDAGSPLACRDAHRRFAWQPLDRESAIEPAENATRIESDPQGNSAAVPPDGHPKARTIMSESTSPPRDNARVNGHSPTTGTPGTEGSPTTGLAALIQEAEALHESLANARARAGKLVAALRRHRKQARLMSSTIAALKQIRLQEVGE